MFLKNYKSAALFFSVIFACVFELKAQTRFGFNAGADVSFVKYEESANEELMKPYKKAKFGFSGGIEIEKKLNPVIGIGARILYTQKGLKYEQKGYSKGKNTMNYVEIPFFAEYEFLKGKTPILGIFAGGYAAWWLNGKYIKTDLQTGQTSKNKVDFDSETYRYNRIDAGLVFGLEKKIENYTIRASCEYGMLSCSQQAADALFHKVMILSLSYILPWKK